jgi:lipooligosaccharide transport system permease protein
MLTGAIAVARRDATIFARLWRGIVFTSFISPLLHLGSMGLGLGGMVRDDAAALGGVDYLAFVAPGLLAASVVQFSAADSLWPVMAGTKWWRTYHAMVASPVRPAELAAGLALWQAARAAMAGSVFLVVAALLGGVPSAWGVLALPAAVLVGAAVGAPVAAFAATRDSDAPFILLMRLGVMPMFLFAGVFFPLDLLPTSAAVLARATPLYHGVELCRAATLGRWDPSVPVHAVVLVAFLVGGLVLGTRTFTRRLAA